MFTLKIKWMRYEKDEEYAKQYPDASPQVKQVDETTLFIPADEIRVHGLVTCIETMSAWPEGEFFNFAVEKVDSNMIQASRLIQVDRENHPSVWYLASNAWILGPDGKTIERIA